MSDQPRSSLLNSFFSLIFFAFGVFLAAPSAQLFYYIYNSDKWPQVTGQVMSSEVDTRWPEEMKGRTQEYRPRIWFSYRVDEKTFVSSNVHLVNPYSRDRKQADAEVARYKPEQAVQVRYNPKDPSICRIEPTIAPITDRIRLGLGVLFAFSGLMAFLGSLFARKET